MRSEPIAILEIVRVVAFALSLMGIVLTDEEQQALAVGLGGVVVVVSIILSIIARSKVFSRDTTETLAKQAASTGKVPVALQPGTATD